MADFAVTRHLAGGVLHVTVTGEVDMATSDQLAAATHDAVVTERLAGIVVDLGQVTFLDSSGIRALVVEHEFAQRHGVSYHVTNPSTVVRRVLEVTGVLALLSGRTGS